MLKLKLLSCGRDMEERTRNGTSFMLTKRKRFKRRDLSKIMDSMPTDHSTLCQDFQ